ncbi:MAG TPA: tripartite tricarboxylate transporter TctB family protein [Dongiaceae bacterium]|nr:tripartite tricarboxylate transporter TctB family protein [Dongiaceae bacterium]
MLGRVQSLGAERLIALLLIIFAVAELYAALQLSVSAEFTLGPGAMPVIYSVGLLIFALVLAIWPAQKAPPVIENPVDVEEEPVVIGNYRIGVITFVLVAVFVASIYFVGFFGGTAIFSFLYILLVLRWSVIKSAAFALVWGGALYYGFDRLLGVQLEPGILFGS